jgi:hypothetical protein
MLPRDTALADEPSIMYLGPTNVAPDGQVTAIEADVGDYPQSGLAVAPGILGITRARRRPFGV